MRVMLVGVGGGRRTWGWMGGGDLGEGEPSSGAMQGLRGPRCRWGWWMVACATQHRGSAVSEVMLEGVCDEGEGAAQTDPCELAATLWGLWKERGEHCWWEWTGEGATTRWRVVLGEARHSVGRRR